MQTEVHGGDIYTRPYRIDFSANINPLGTPPAVLEAACRGVSRAADYPDIHCRKLRQAISRREEVPADQIICGNGAAELIFALAQAVKPRRALLTAPGFAEYEQALGILGDGCRTEFYLCRKEQGFRLEEDYLARQLIDSREKLPFEADRFTYRQLSLFDDRRFARDQQDYVRQVQA